MLRKSRQGIKVFGYRYVNRVNYNENTLISGEISAHQAEAMGLGDARNLKRLDCTVIENQITISWGQCATREIYCMCLMCKLWRPASNLHTFAYEYARKVESGGIVV